MKGIFLYDDGQGNVRDEDGNDPMEPVLPDPFRLRSLTDLPEYLKGRQQEESPMLTEVEEDLEAPETSSGKAKISTRKYNKYTEEDRMRFFFYHIEKLMKPAAAAKVAHINERTAQRWAKQYKEDQAKLLPVKLTTRKRGPPKNLQSEHKEHIKDIYDENAQLTIEQAMESLTENFEDLKITKTSVYNFMTKECNLSVKRATFHSTKRNSPDNLTARYEWVTKWMATDMDFMKNCIFIDESGFHMNLTRAVAWSGRGEQAIVPVSLTRAANHSILGAIASFGVIKMSLRMPEKPEADPIFKKRKISGYKRKKKVADEDEKKKKKPKGTVTEHYFKFVGELMDVLDEYEGMKGFYLIMDNAPIHTANLISTEVERRGYKCVYLPPYSPELNRIEQFWSVVKARIKRQMLMEEETLSTRIAEACNDVPLAHLENFVQHSINQFERCLNREPL